MRVAIDPVPLVLGIYARVGGLMTRAVSRAEDADPVELGRRYGQPGASEGEWEVQRLVKDVHGEVKMSDKLLKKTRDVWRMAADGGRVDLVVHPRGEGDDPPSYVLLRPDDVREILRSVRSAAEGAGEDQATLQELGRAAEQVSGRASDYYTFGFDARGS